MVGLEEKTIEEIKRNPSHLAFVTKFHAELKKENPQLNGEINMDYALEEWVKRGFHKRFGIFHVNLPHGDKDVIYMEIIGRYQGA